MSSTAPWTRICSADATIFKVVADRSGRQTGRVLRTGLGGDDEERGSRVRALRGRMPPRNELPAHVDTPQVVHQDANLLVGLMAEAFTTGLRLTVQIRLARRPTRFPAGPPVSVRRHAERLSGAFSASDRRLQVGVVLADGRRLVGTEQLHFLRQDAALLPGTPILAHLGDRGDGPLSVDVSYWLTPLPPSGPLVLALRGADLGLPETTAALDGAAISAAVSRVTVL